MSSSLARRTGTVGALVAAAGVTLVAGAWPALAAAPVDPRSAEVQGVGIGLETAPGQTAEPTAEPVPAAPAEPVVEETVVEETVVAEPVVEEPAATSPRGRSGLAPGRDRVAPQEPVTEPSAGTVEPAAEPVAEPVAEAPVVGPPTGLGKGRDKQATTTPDARPEPAPRSAPAGGPPADAADAPAAPAAPAAPQGQGSGAPADRGPAADAPVSAPVAGPRSLPQVVGPVAPMAQPVPAAAPAPVMGPQVPRVVRPSALATAGTRSGRAQVAAADVRPLRPTGAEPIVLPAAAAQPRPVPVDLGEALPSVAATTVQAVARRPEWPLGIAGVVLVFLLVQNRIDRRDPKLAGARVEDEAPLEFASLDERPHLRLVVAA